MRGPTAEANFGQKVKISGPERRPAIHRRGQGGPTAGAVRSLKVRQSKDLPGKFPVLLQEIQRSAISVLRNRTRGAAHPQLHSVAQSRCPKAILW